MQIKDNLLVRHIAPIDCLHTGGGGAKLWVLTKVDRRWAKKLLRPLFHRGVELAGTQTSQSLAHFWGLSRLRLRKLRTSAQLGLTERSREGATLYASLRLLRGYYGNLRTVTSRSRQTPFSHRLAI